MFLISLGFYSHADEFTTLKEDLLNHYLQFEENILTIVDDFKHKQLRYLKEELISTTGNLISTPRQQQCNVMWYNFIL